MVAGRVFFEKKVCLKSKSSLVIIYSAKRPYILSQLVAAVGCLILVSIKAQK